VVVVYIEDLEGQLVIQRRQNHITNVMIMLVVAAAGWYASSCWLLVVPPWTRHYLMIR